MNPILSRNYFVPDVEAHVMPDGRLYLYGSFDISGEKSYCSKELHCFSTDDMLSWREEGIIFCNDGEQSKFKEHPNVLLYAPDAIYKNGKYYLFICCQGDFEGVAVADSPCGPFSEATPIKGADGDGIDPAIFVDDDGTAYYFWGQFHLRGGILTEDMTALLSESVKDNILTEHEHGFHEGASIRKRNGKYYLVYTDISRGRATCMSYAVSDSPLGPYTKCGVIIDNYGCDPQSWNNHGSIECFKGQWYVFYHRSSQNSNTSRRVCVEPIFFDENGLIYEVQQTCHGAEKPLDATKIIGASIASKLSRDSYIVPVGQGEVVVCPCCNYAESWIEYRMLDFGEGVSELVLRIKGKGTISARCENRLLGITKFQSDDFTSITLPVQFVSGVHTLWILLDGENIVLDSFYFNQIK